MILDSIDERLLDFTKKFCDKTYQSVGVNNFDFAMMLGLVNLAFNLFILVWYIQIKNRLEYFWFLSTYHILYFFICVCLMVLSKLTSFRYKEKYLNDARSKFKEARHMAFGVLLYFWFLFMVIFFYAIPVIVSSLLTLIILYLISVEPSPPSQSKLKRLLSSISSFRLKGLAPSPA